MVADLNTRVQAAQSEVRQKNLVGRRLKLVELLQVIGLDTVASEIIQQSLESFLLLRKKSFCHPIDRLPT
jgi:hypothetical protein